MSIFTGFDALAGKSPAPSIFDMPSEAQTPCSDLFERYARAGFEVDLLPIIPPDGELAPGTSVTAAARGKTPGGFYPAEGTWKGRARWNDRDATQADLRRWSTWPNVGIGIRTKRVAGIDIDVTLEPLVNEIEKLAIDMLGDAPCRIGNAPKRLLVYRVALPGKIRIEAKHEDSGDVQAVEILADGQQFVAEGTHAKTGKPYRWRRESPLTLGLDGLPAVGREGVQAFRAAVTAHLEKVLQPLGYKITNTESGGGAKAENNAVPLTTEVAAKDWARAYQLIVDTGYLAEGNRDTGIHKLFGAIKDLIGDRTEYDDVAEHAWQECAPTLSRAEFEKTRNSAWKGGQNQPGVKSEAIAGADAWFGAEPSSESPAESAKDVPPVRAVRPPLSVEDEWLDRDLPEPDFLLGSWLHTTSRALIVAPTGAGKTNFGLALAAAMAAGKPFLNWPSRRPSRVLYIDGEMSRRLLKRRLKDAWRRIGCSVPDLYAFSHEDAEEFKALNTPEGRAYVAGLINCLGGVDFIVFDNIMSLLSGNMRETDSWESIQPWIKSLTKRATGQVWFHHTGHDESRSYGDKTKEWQMDTVIHLTPVKRDGIDVCFDLSFRKARERMPENRHEFADMQIALSGDAWTWQAAATEGQRDAETDALLTSLLEVLQDAKDGEPLSVQKAAKALLDRTLAGAKPMALGTWRARIEKAMKDGPQEICGWVIRLDKRDGRGSQVRTVLTIEKMSEDGIDPRGPFHE